MTVVLPEGMVKLNTKSPMQTTRNWNISHLDDTTPYPVPQTRIVLLNRSLPTLRCPVNRLGVQTPGHPLKTLELGDVSKGTSRRNLYELSPK